MDTDKSFHAGERQSRHEDVEITEDDIKKLVRKKARQIVAYLVFDKINVGDFIHLFDPQSKLNVICKIDPIGKVSASSPIGLRVKVITVMIKQNFKPKSGTITVESKKRSIKVISI